MVDARGNGWLLDRFVDDTGRIVTCSYWIDARRRTVRCNSFATLNWPV